MKKFFTSLIRVIPAYLPLFVAIMNMIIFLIHLHFIVNMNIANLHILIAYPITLLHSFISSSRFYCYSLFCNAHIGSCHLQTEAIELLQLDLFFPGRFSLASVSNTTLREVVRVVILALFQTQGNVLAFPLLLLLLVMGFLYMTLTVLS